MEEASLADQGDDLMDLPPGFRFHPTDEEIISYYLTERVMNSSFSARAIGEVDLNKCEPWDLPSNLSLYLSLWVLWFFGFGIWGVISNLLLDLIVQRKQRWERRNGISFAREIGSILQAWERIELPNLDTGRPLERIKRFTRGRVVLLGWRRPLFSTEGEPPKERKAIGSCTNTDWKANSHITTSPKPQRYIYMPYNIPFSLLSFCSNPTPCLCAFSMIIIIIFFANGLALVIFFCFLVNSEGYSIFMWSIWKFCCRMNGSSVGYSTRARGSNEVLFLRR